MRDVDSGRIDHGGADQEGTGNRFPTHTPLGLADQSAVWRLILATDRRDLKEIVNSSTWF